MLRDKLYQKKIITLEVLAPLITEKETLLQKLEPFKDYVDAVNVPSNPLGKLRPDALSYAHIIQERTCIETIPHFVARSLTSLGFESQLLGAAALGIVNILCVTGDRPVEGRGVFELNAIRLLEIAKNLAAGVSTSRGAIRPVNLCLCAGFNPNVPNLQGEFAKAVEKCRHGAGVFFTQPIFRPAAFLKVLEEFRRRHSEAKVIAGLSFLHTKKRAFSLMKFMGIPYEYVEIIEDGDETEILYATAKELKDHVDGFYVIPIADYSSAFKLVEKIRRML
ncbi:methylenetetrahydrofolate reductase [candidate division WOR-3 bacterium]|nr:methylenetetrahydrofolate reductase [candidate division WOR-3 bacterium]